MTASVASTAAIGWHAGGDALAHQQDVGLEVPELGGEHRAAAAEAGLHLVEDQHPAEPAAEAGEPLPERRRRRQDAALADDGLDEHAGDLLRVRPGGRAGTPR